MLGLALRSIVLCEHSLRVETQPRSQTRRLLGAVKRPKVLARKESWVICRNIATRNDLASTIIENLDKMAILIVRGLWNRVGDYLSKVNLDLVFMKLLQMVYDFFTPLDEDEPNHSYIQEEQSV